MTLYNSGMVEVYPNQVPYDTDILRSNLYNLTGVSALAATTLGCGINYGTVVRGFPCVPVSPPGLSVVVGSNQTPDIIQSLQPLNATAYGSLPIDTTPSHQQFKQGFNWGQVTLSTPAPVTTGFSVIHLVQVAFSTQDVNNVSRPYFNSANPTAPIFNNNFDTRTDLAIIQLKQGIAASSPTPPTPDAGFTALWYITVAFGQTSIISGNIAKVSSVEGAPFITESLTNKISKSMADTLYASIAALQTPFNVYAANDVGGSANTIVANPSPAYTSIVGSRIYVTVAHSNTGATTLNVSSLGAIATRVIKSGALAAFSGGEITVGGTYEFYGIAGPFWQLINPNAQAVVSPQVVTTWDGSASPVAVTGTANIGITSGAITAIANYGRAVMSSGFMQNIPLTSAAKVQFPGSPIGQTSWWISGSDWFLPLVAGKYLIKAVVNSIGTAALQSLTLQSNINANIFTALGVGYISEPVQIEIPGITVIADGSTSYFFLTWTNNSTSLATTLGEDGVSGFNAGNTNYFEISYLGT